MHTLATRLLLNVGHALDHMFLLVFATAVTSIAQEFGIARWEDLMPYAVASFFFFGIGSLPSGRLGDSWGRRPMMVVFFVGIGLSAILVGAATSPIAIALALALLGCFASIYHPVGIPMLVQGSPRPGLTIGVNGLAGNLGVAVSAIVTGYFVKHFGWRMAFVVPGLVAIACGIVFALVATRELTPPAKRAPAPTQAGDASLARLFLVMTIAATSGSLLFNFTTNSNYELLADRLREITRDPARLGTLLAAVYAVAALMQVVMGRLIDRHPMKTLYVGVLALQALLLLVATRVDGWAFYAVQFLFMATVFGAIPFTDAMLVRYVDDRMRSRVSGMRLAVSFGASSVAVWLIGPVVKEAGFTALLALMAATSLVTLLVATRLPHARGGDAASPRATSFSGTR